MSTQPYFAHERAIVETKQIGPGTRVWANAHVLAGARLGADCNLGDGVFVENDVVLGDRVTVKNGVQVWDGVTLEDDVFVGPNASFTNDYFPRSRQRSDAFLRTIVKRGASIGANATILPGVTVGRGAFVAAGAVATKDVPPWIIVRGTPARAVGVAGPKGPLPIRTRDTGGALPGGCSFISVLTKTNEFGSLSFLEEHAGLPFAPRRYFTLSNIPPGALQGRTAHKACAQYFSCMGGSVRLALDDGRERADVLLRDPGDGLHVPPGVWVTVFDHSPATALLILASHVTDESDLLRDYDAFLRFKGI